MVKAKSRHAAETPAPKDDADIIRACVAYAMAVSASHNAFSCDPTGNSTFAEVATRRTDQHARRYLQDATAPALHPEGIEAKLRATAVLIGQQEQAAVSDIYTFEEYEVDFLRSIVADARKFLKPVLHERWLASRGKTPGAVPLAVIRS